MVAVSAAAAKKTGKTGKARAASAKKRAAMTKKKPPKGGKKGKKGIARVRQKVFEGLSKAQRKNIQKHEAREAKHHTASVDIGNMLSKLMPGKLSS